MNFLVNLICVCVYIYTHTNKHILGFPGGSVVKNPPANAGDAVSIPGSGRSSGRKKWQPTPVLLPGKSHGQGSLVGYSPWGHKRVRHNLGAKQIHTHTLV